MLDPLSEVITLLRPRTVFTKGISAAGRWAVRYSDFGQPSFCAVLEGRCRLSVDGIEPITMEAGDFVLLPATPAFTMSGFDRVPARMIDPHLAAGSQEEVRHGDPDGPPDVRLLGGYFLFDSPDAAFLSSLFPPLVHLRCADRLSTLVRLVRDEALESLPGRDLILSRLVEALLVQALRTAQGIANRPSLLRGLGDARLSLALRRMHADPARSWTVAQLAKEAAMSRSAFFERFARVVGVSPMEYLLSWRMIVAKDLLRSQDVSLAEVAERTGYSSSATFGIAFARHVGQAPRRYARASLPPARTRLR